MKGEIEAPDHNVESSTGNANGNESTSKRLSRMSANTTAEPGVKGFVL